MGTSRTYETCSTAVLALAMWFCASVAATAQPVWTIEDDGGDRTVQVAPGDQVCLRVSVSDFVDIVYLSAEFRFDSTVLAFDSVAYFAALPDFYPEEHIDIPDGVAPGRFRIAWSRLDYVPGENEIGTSIPDGGRMLDLCFTAIGPAGSFSPVVIKNVPRPTRSPDPYIVSANSATRDIGLYTNDATVVIGGAPLKLAVENTVVAASGDIACVDVTAVGDWTGVRDAEFFLRYDAGALTYTGASSTVPGLTSANVSVLEIGLLQITTTSPIALNTGDVLLTLCFETNRACDVPAAVPVPDVVEQDSTGRLRLGAALEPRALLVEGGQIDVAPCEGGVIITGQPAVGSSGDSRCVGIEVNGFNGGTGGTFVFQFNDTQVLVEDVTPAPELAGRVTYDVDPGGTLTIVVSPGAPLFVPKGKRIFDICVQILGESPTIVEFELVGSASGVDGVSGGIAQGGGAFVVILPNTVPRLTIEQAEKPQDSIVCLELSVSGFRGLTAFRTSLEWDADVIKLIEVIPSGALRSNGWNDADRNFARFEQKLFTKQEEVIDGRLTLGKFGINWSAFASVPGYDTTLADGTKIFDLCFLIVGERGECSNLREAVRPVTADGLTTFETLIDREVTESWNDGLLVDEGYVCSTYDSAWTLRFPDDVLSITPEGTCFDITLEDYTRMDTSSFSLDFDESLFELVSITPVRALATAADIDLDRVDEGLIGIHLAHPRPRSLLGTSTAFTLCFQAVPGPAACAPVSGVDEPEPRYGFANRRERTVLVVGGEMCRTSKGPPIPTPNVTGVSCAGEADASITIEIDDLLRDFSYAWTKDDVAFSTDRDLTGLAPGTYVITVTDDDGFAAPVSLSVVVEPGGPAPIAQVRDSVSATCDFAGAVEVPLAGNSSDAFGGSIDWRPLDGGSVVGDGATSTPELLGAGRFEITATSPGGCAARDTIVVIRPRSAAVSIASVPELTCRTSSVDLIGAVGTHAEPVTLAWTTSSGELPPGRATDENTLSDVVRPGVYVLTSTTTATVCTYSDSVAVTTNRPVISAVAMVTDALGAPDSLNCRNGAAVTLRTEVDGDGATDLRYRWTTIAGEFVGPTNAPEATAVAAATYRITATDETTGCEATDTVAVAQSFAQPIADAGANDTITCFEPARVLRAASPGTRLYQYRWAGPAGGLQDDGEAVSAIVGLGGVYRLEVTDVDNGCRDTDSVEVLLDTATPRIEIVDPVTRTLSCATDQVVLTGRAEAPGRSAPIEVGWSTTTEGTFSPGVDANEIIVTQAGTFYYAATDATSGCRDSMAIVIDANGDRPAIDATVSGQLDCDTDAVTLEGRGPGPGFSVSWTSDSDGELDISSTNVYRASARAPGRYTLTVTDDATGCTSEETVEVTLDTVAPRATLPRDTEGNCYRLPFSIGVGGPVGLDTSAFTYSWTGPSATTIGTDATVTVREEGQHALTVTSLTNGCATEVETEVRWRERPEASFTVDTAELICGRDSVTLTLSTASAESGEAVSWRIDDATGAFEPPRRLTPTSSRYRAFGGATYRLVLTSADGACVTESEPATVTDRRVRLQVEAGDPLQLSCRDTVVTAEPEALGSDDWIVSWVGPTTDAIDRPLALSPAFSIPGTYRLLVFDPNTRCSGEDSVEVLAPVTEGLFAALPGGFELACGETRMVEVGYGTASDAAASFRWYESASTASTVSTSSFLEIGSDGRYFVEVVDEETGCSALDSIDVTQAAPISSKAIPELTLDCAQSATSATFAIDNPDAVPVSYTWTAVDGGTVVDGATEATARLTPGVYEATATALDGDCRLTERVLVSAYAGWVATARAEARWDDCLNEVTLAGTASDTMASRWRALEGAAPELDEAAATQVLLDLAPGVYRFAYELVPEYCLPSAPATVTVEIRQAPRIEIYDAVGRSGARTRDTTVQLIASALREYVATLDSVRGEARATINSANRLGIRDWTSEELEIQYEVCERDCPSRCKTVRYLLLRGRAAAGSPVSNPGVPNAITPNNDGLNERFVVDAIVEDPDRYPNARFTLVNRWGDILYTAQPYADQFDGRSNDGRDIPDGTYYYLLELDVTNAEIYRGHLTIFR